MSHTVELGSLLKGGEGRDAVHVAISPSVADELLYPGQHVGFAQEGDTTRIAAVSKKVGIVDPFLTAPVAKDQACWLFLYPNTITSLRHQWVHPAFGEEGAAIQPPKAASRSEQWIRDFAERVGLSYADLMQGARDWLEGERTPGGYGNYLNRGELLEGEYVPDEFWTHYEEVTGDKVDDNHRGSFFTCSC